MGSALLSGIVFCSRCGVRMRVHYSRSQRPRYNCTRHLQRGLEQNCHGVAAIAIDALVAQQLLRALEPAALDLSLRASEDVQQERERLALHWNQQLERARFESAKAQRHYRIVDPENRLVARTLEQQWEQALQKEQQVQEEYDRFLRQAPPDLTQQEKECIRALATDIPSLWAASTTTAADRKELIRCLIDRVVVGVQGNTEHVDVTVHWAGGYVSQHQAVRPVFAYEQLRDYDRLVERTRELRKTGHSADQIAKLLNKEGFHPVSVNSRFDRKMMRQLLLSWGLAGGLTDEDVLGPDEWRLSELARKLGIHPSKLRRWARLGWLHARRPRVVWSFIIWANREELERLGRLRDHAELHPYQPYPQEFTTPNPRPPASPERHDQA